MECIQTKTVTVLPKDKPWFHSKLQLYKEKLKQGPIFNRSLSNLKSYRKQRNHMNNLKIKHTKEHFFVKINGI